MKDQATAAGVALERLTGALDRSTIATLMIVGRGRMACANRAARRPILRRAAMLG